MLKKGDKVIVIAGKDKGKTATITRAFPATSKVLLDGVNMMKKQRRGRKSGEKGSVTDMPMPIHTSNVMLLDPKSGKQTRLGKKKIGEKMVRVTKKSDQEV